MPNKKTPTLEEAKFLFNKYPERKLHDWATEWDCSAERVRQIRNECGVGSIFKVDYDIVEIVANRIETGEYPLTSNKLYEDLIIGRDAFARWIREDIDTAQRIQEAQEKYKLSKLDPEEKKCVKCLIQKSVEEFTRSQKYADGYNKFCNKCLEELKENQPKESPRKTCFMCKKTLSLGSFDAKSHFCKRCRSKSRRAKRARDLKTQ